MNQAPSTSTSSNVIDLFKAAHNFHQSLAEDLAACTRFGSASLPLAELASDAYKAARESFEHLKASGIKGFRALLSHFQIDSRPDAVVIPLHGQKKANVDGCLICCMISVFVVRSIYGIRVKIIKRCH